MAVNDLDNPKVFTPRPATGQFPSWQSVIPKAKPKLTIELDSAKLLALLRYVTQFTDNDNNCVRLELWDSTSAIRLDATNSKTGQGMTAVLMPLQPETGGKYPHAYGEEKAKVPAAEPVTGAEVTV